MAKIIDHVKAMEGRENHQRGDYVLKALGKMGITPKIQECRRPSIRNIIVDFGEEAEPKTLFTAHYDAVKGSPGANDNASSAAVLLALCQHLAGSHKPIRAVFFDREEGLFDNRWLKLGLMGSFYYVMNSGHKDITALNNLEFCGLGDCLVIWPVAEGKEPPEAALRAEAVAAKLNIPVRRLSVPWAYMSSDHFPFRISGFSNAVSLSMLPLADFEEIQKKLANINTLKVMLGRKTELPEPFSVFHTPDDNSSHISEKSLQLMLSLVLETL